MAYIQREGGERFVIPSYRDVISKRKGALKDEILSLSAKYGEHMTLQRRGLAHFEVAFSQDAGYLFGECVWFYFKRPTDLIYCEAVPETTEAYLVIVKDGAVFLDGIFPLENIPEELLIFTTQRGEFDVYLYGDVPLSQEPQEGKFSLAPEAIKSFNFLEKPLFQELPAVKAYELRLVDVVLREQGIGVFPTKYVVAGLVAVGLIYMMYTFVTMHRKRIIITAPTIPTFQNPYLDYNKSLATPSPTDLFQVLLAYLRQCLAIPGWTLTSLDYTDGKLTGKLTIEGAETSVLYDWADKMGATVTIINNGFAFTLPMPLPTARSTPRSIYKLDRVVGSLLDRVHTTLPPGSNTMTVMAPADKGVYKSSEVTVSITALSPQSLMAFFNQLRNLPLVLTKVSLKLDHGAINGTINFQALGN